jgi:hypothetical protein
MAAGTWTPINQTRTKILDGTLKTGATWKVALFTATSSVTATSTLYSGLTGEVGTTNTGYTTGGVAITPLLAGTTAVTWSFTTNPSWLAGTANLAAQLAALYDTVSSFIWGYVWLDSGGATVTTTSGNTLTIDSHTGPVFTLA